MWDAIHMTTIPGTSTVMLYIWLNKSFPFDEHQKKSWPPHEISLILDKQILVFIFTSILFAFTMVTIVDQVHH